LKLKLCAALSEHCLRKNLSTQAKNKNKYQENTKKKSETDSAAKGLPITNGNANNKAALSRNAVGESINIYIINSKLYYDDYYYFPSPALLFEPGQISVIRRKSLLLLPIIGIPF